MSSSKRDIIRTKHTTNITLVQLKYTTNITLVQLEHLTNCGLMFDIKHKTNI
jgi:hypothetical protein